MKRSGLGLAALLGAVVTWGACAEPRAEQIQDAALWPAMRVQAAALAREKGPAGRGPAAQPLSPVDGQRQGGALVLADVGSHRLALIADEDAAALRVIDRATLQQLAITTLPGRPGQVMVGADGRAYVALRDLQQVMAFELAGDTTGSATKMAGPLTLQQVGSLPTAAEPIGLAMSPDGDTLLVASGWGRRLQGLSLQSGQVRFSLALAREPRSVAISPDGKTAFVSHAMGPAISRVALGEGTPRVTPLQVAGTDHETVPRFFPARCGDHRCSSEWRRVAGEPIERHAVQGFALAAFRQQAVSPLVLARINPKSGAAVGYDASGERFMAHEPVLVQLGHDSDEVTIRSDQASYVASKAQTRALTLGRQSCLLPRAIAVDERRGQALVGCVGNDQVIAYQLDGTPLIDAMLARWRVPAGPVGIAVDAQVGEALVWSQFDGKLSRVALPMARARKHWARSGFGHEPAFSEPQQVATIPPLQPAEGGPAMLSQAALRGRALFHDAGNDHISADGRACASCHPDGRDDGITWPSPLGSSQTPMLAGRLGGDTGPYGWHGDSDTIEHHLQHTFKRLHGRGLEGEDLAALLAYLQEMPAPPKAHHEAHDAASVAHGKALFEDQQVGCAVCHQQGGGSDGTAHDVGSGHKLKTPSLRFISGTAPYFHDGRYATLMDMLRETKGQMGWGAQLSDADLEAIEAYLLTL